MNYKKLGLILIITGIFIANIRSFLTITGVVINISAMVFRGSIVIGGLFIIGGFVLVLLGYKSISSKNTGSRTPKKKKVKIEHNYPTKEELKRFKKGFDKKKI